MELHASETDEWMFLRQPSVLRLLEESARPGQSDLFAASLALCGAVLRACHELGQLPPLTHVALTAAKEDLQKAPVEPLFRHWAEKRIAALPLILSREDEARLIEVVAVVALAAAKHMPEHTPALRL